MKQVPISVAIHHLTLIERSARQARELLCIAQHSSEMAKQPKVVTPGVLAQLNGHVPENVYAQQAQQAAANANMELGNMLTHAGLLRQLVTEEGGSNDPKQQPYG